MFLYRVAKKIPLTRIMQLVVIQLSEEAYSSDNSYDRALGAVLLKRKDSCQDSTSLLLRAE